MEMLFQNLQETENHPWNETQGSNCLKLRDIFF